MRMPALFIGHGSPMNIFLEGPYAADLREQAESLPRPAAILVISAHWTTPQLRVTASATPRQLYDFIGFPEEFYKFTYETPGDPILAGRIASLLETAGKPCTQDPTRGIDHAAWAILSHMYPEADIPVLELSLSYHLPPLECFDIGKALSPLREEGILIIGSGNLVHNLYEFDYEMNVQPYPWAVAFNTLVKEKLAKKDKTALASYAETVPESKQAVPTPDHYLPLLAAAGTMDSMESAVVFHESFQNGSIAMTSFIFA